MKNIYKSPLIYALTILSPLCNSFHLSIPKNHNSITFLTTPIEKHKLKASNTDIPSSKKKNIVVVSPPGGIGQISAIESVKQGASVYWFIVSNPSSSTNVKLSSDVWNTYSQNIQIAGSSYENANSQKSLESITSWCNEIDGLICTLDGLETKDLDEYNAWKNALFGITQKVSGYAETKVAIASLEDKTFKKFGIGNLFKGGNVDSLEEAIGTDENTVVFYYGDLFGVPDSSDDSSPFQGGPRRDPILRDEYTMRSIRLDSIPVEESEEEVAKLLKLSPRTSRLSIGEASAAYLLSSALSKQRQELLLSSTRGLYPLSLQDWNVEFNKVTTKKQLGGDSTILSISFGSIPSIKRFFDWLETKWAPAILRSYDIAGIRVGERPVSTIRTQEDELNIIFQTLDENTFQSTTIGKLIISLKDDTSIIVKREITNDTFLQDKKRKNLLQGEDVLLRSLEDASNQAIEKGLATKVTAVEESVPEPVVQPVVVQTPSSPQSAGPKSKGARRSLERSRGSTSRSSRKKMEQSKNEDKDTFQ